LGKEGTLPRMKRVAAVAFAVACAACGHSSSSGTNLTTSPSAATKTETFSGTVNQGTMDFHTFTVTVTGEVDVTLTAAGPPSTIFMGLGVGLPTSDGSACTLLTGASVLTQAATTPQLAGTAAPGTYCVAVFDAGNLSAAITYSVTVAHS